MSQSLRSQSRDYLIRRSAPVSDRAFRERPRVRVVALHDVPLRDKDRFVAKVRWLAQNYRLVSLANAHHRAGLDDRRLNVALTFDDGFAEHATLVAPVLEDLNVPATFFVPSGAIDLTSDEAERFAKDGLRRRGSFRFMSSPQLKQLAEHRLFEIGGHTTNHADLGSIGDQGELDGEIVRDKAVLERLIGIPVEWFAFPFGSSTNISAWALRTIEGAGYKAAFTIVPGFWSRKQNSFLVRRDSLSLAANDDLWHCSLRGGNDAVGWVKHRRRLNAVDARGRSAGTDGP